MGTTPDAPGLPGPELNDDDAVAFDDLGRRAGAALRRPAPEHGASAIARRGRRQQAVRGVVAGGVALGALVGAMFVVTRGDGSDTLTPVDTVAETLAPTTTAAAVLTPVDTVAAAETTTTLARAGDPSPGATISNGWVAFAAGDPHSGIYLVQEGTPARRIAGSDSDGIEQVCPAFSPDGTRLAYGQATGDQDSYQDAALVITDLTAAGDVATTDTIALDDISRPPCAIWSADGRWVAFGAGTLSRHVFPSFVDEVWVVDTATDDIRRLSGLKVTDIEWAPDATELFIASDGGIVMYSVANDETRHLGGSGVESFALSPDGQSIAFQRRRPVQGDTSPPPSPAVDVGEFDLWLMDANVTGERILAANFGALHGIGPVWSPDGDHIAYQRGISGPPPTPSGLRDGHEVVVVTVGDNDPLEPAGTQVVIPPDTAGPDRAMYPSSVTWSPDGTTLLYDAWGEVAGVVAVRVDGETPPVVLSGALNVPGYSGFQRMPRQTWGRVP